MPLYEYKCKHCLHRVQEFRKVRDRNNGGKCKRCGGELQKLVSLPGALITDTSFGYTGKIDPRLGTRPVEGRKDWHDRVAKRGYMPLGRDDLKKMHDDCGTEPETKPLLTREQFEGVF